jgi:hypothetical protein
MVFLGKRFVSEFLRHVMLKTALIFLRIFNISEPFEDEMKKLSE